MGVQIIWADLDSYTNSKNVRSKESRRNMKSQSSKKEMHVCLKEGGKKKHWIGLHVIDLSSYNYHHKQIIFAIIAW